MRENDMKLLSSLRDSIISKFGLPEKKIPEDILPMLFSELSPVAAIVGGVLGQEVIKVISNKDAPHNNFFLYNPLDTCGIVETIGYWIIRKIIIILEFDHINFSAWYFVGNLLSHSKF